MLGAVGEENREDINREREAPEKQRALLSRPDGRELEKRRERAVAVLHDVSHGEIVGEEKISEAAEAQPDEHANGHAGVACALDQQRTARDDRGDAAAESIKSAKECQQQGKRSKQVQRLPPYSKNEERIFGKLIPHPLRMTPIKRRGKTPSPGLSQLLRSGLVAGCDDSVPPGAASYLEAHLACNCSATKRPSGMACPSIRHCAPSLKVSGSGSEPT